MSVLIRPETVADVTAIGEVNRLAFGQGGEARLVEELRAGGFVRVSLVAELHGRVVGHILFSELSIDSDAQSVSALSLAPMAVLPDFQRQGIGQRLVKRGLEVCRDQGHRIVIVLGHPEFYPRFGFSAKLAAQFTSPFSGDAFMALELVPGSLQGIEGQVCYPPPFGAFA